ncbi:MAG: Mu transposase C-terminal domain-containing protein [Pseudomonadota bacterium]|nr:Mu transposase C-terminal domain-containing protein [Pseudomonadota bacterium]
MTDFPVKSHYDAGALAAMQLPGMPTTRSAVFKKAKNEGWAFVEVQGKGGKGGIRREYVLPTSIMEAIRMSSAKSLMASVPAKRLALRAADQLPLIETEDQALKADARKGVLLALDTLMNRSGYPLKKAARVLIEMARNGEGGVQMIAMLKMARDQRGRSSADGLPSERSVLRFVEYERAGMLAPKHRERDMSVPDWAPAFLTRYQQPEKPTVEHAYREFSKTLLATNVTPPSVWQVRRFLAKVGNVTLEMGRMGDRELKSLKPFIRRDFASLLPADVYSADGHTFDAEVQHPMHGRPFRPEITSVVDIATRKTVGWSVGLAESAFAVLDALRHSVLRGGIPAILYVDNGSGYKNQLMADVGTGLLSRLGIQMINSLPYNSQARGVIEKLHQTIWVNAAKKLPGYIGRDMDRQAKLNVFKLSRKAIAKTAGEAHVMPLMAWDSFLAFCDGEVAEYNARPHRSLPKIADPSTGRRRHMTPDEAWALAESKGFAAHTVADDDLRPLFRPQTLRTVRRCELELFGNRYFARALEEFHTQQLRVGYDIHDPAKVWVYDESGRFICNAELDGNVRDYMPKSVIEQARDKRAAGREHRLAVKLEEVREERRGMPAIDQMETVSIPGFMNMSRTELAERAQHAEFIEVRVDASLPETPAAASVLPDVFTWTVPATPQERISEWTRIAEFTEDELISPKQSMWRKTYQETAEFRTYQRKSA